LSEAAGLFWANHPNIVKAIAVVDNKVEPVLVIELYFGSVKQYFAKVDDVPLAHICHLLLDGASALRYLHDNRVVHRDFAARNVLVERLDDDPFVRGKLSDFGLVRKTHTPEDDKVRERPDWCCRLNHYAAYTDLFSRRQFQQCVRFLWLCCCK
jgi:serine/threonine protein kinase